MPLITVSAAAERLGCHRDTVDRMIRRGELAAYQLPGGAIRIDEHELADLLRACRINPKENAREKTN